MQTLINETVRVLREHDGAAAYELSLEEIAQLIETKIATPARQKELELELLVSGRAQFKNRDANLIMLILENLLHNAIQATPLGKRVTLQIEQRSDLVLCEVRDEGEGLPEHLKNSLFKPCQSSKEGGSGIGLAISKQLAAALGAELDLKSSSSSGCIFALGIPLALCNSEPATPKQSSMS
jgi:signal transduction histidine kinase